MKPNLKRARRAAETRQRSAEELKKILIDAHFDVIFRDPEKRSVIEAVASGERDLCQVTMDGLKKPYLIDTEEAKRLVERYSKPGATSRKARRS